MTSTMPASGGQGATLWSAIVRPGSGQTAAEIRGEEEAILRLVSLTSPTVAAWLLGPRAEPVIGAEAIEQSRLYNRFRRHAALGWARRFAEAGIDLAYLKGFATTHVAYPDPDLRGMGDIDLLVRGSDVARLATLLQAEGFAFRRPAGVPRWGPISDASFDPLVAPDGSLAFDIHIQPDDYPVHRSLDIEAVLAASRSVDVDGVPLRVPGDVHLLLLALTNAIRDKFAPSAMRSVIDAVVLLSRTGAASHWDTLFDLARRGGYARPLRAPVLLLERLGVDESLLPDRAFRRPLTGPAASALDGVVRSFETFFATEPTSTTLAWRELVLTAEPRTVLFKYRRRLAGLAAPSSGRP